MSKSQKCFRGKLINKLGGGGMRFPSPGASEACQLIVSTSWPMVFKNVPFPGILEQRRWEQGQWRCFTVLYRHPTASKGSEEERKRGRLSDGGSGPLPEHEAKKNVRDARCKSRGSTALHPPRGLTDTFSLAVTPLMLERVHPAVSAWQPVNLVPRPIIVCGLSTVCLHSLRQKWEVSFFNSIATFGIFSNV